MVKVMSLLESLKYLFVISVLIVFPASIMWGLQIISYDPTPLIRFVLWIVFYPIAAITFFYFIYVKRNSRLDRLLMKDASLRYTKNEWKIRIYKVSFILFFPAMLNYTLIAYLALASHFLAKEPLSELVSVEEARCAGKGKTDLKLTIINRKENEEHTIRFYHDCISSDPESLYGKSIKVYGHQWMLGKVYEGYDPSPLN